MRVQCKLTQFNSPRVSSVPYGFGVIHQVPLLRSEFQLPKLSFQSNLRRRATSRWALPHISSFHMSKYRPTLPRRKSLTGLEVKASVVVRGGGWATPWVQYSSCSLERAMDGHIMRCGNITCSSCPSATTSEIVKRYSKY